MLIVGIILVRVKMEQRRGVVQKATTMKLPDGVSTVVRSSVSKMLLIVAIRFGITHLILAAIAQMETVRTG